MKRALITSVLTSLLVSASLAATNLVSNTATVTNRTQAIVTYTMSNGVARVQDPTGRLVGTAEEVALRIAAEGQVEIASAAADAAGTAMEEWNEFIRTNDTHVLYIDGRFGQDLPALAPNLCGWVAAQSFDGTNDHYYIWFNRELSAPPSMCARISSAGGTNWIYGTWKDWNEVKYVDPKTGKEWTKPYGARVSYLESHGTEYINCGLAHSDDFRYKFRIAATGLTSFNQFMGIDNVLVFGSNGTTWRANAINSAQPYVLNDFYEVELYIENERRCAKVESEVLVGGAKNVTNYSFLLFAANDYIDKEKIQYWLKCRISTFSIFRSDIELQRLIPVIDLLGRPAMYDQVSGQFFYNQGTGRFTYGPILDASAPCRELIVPRRNADCVLKTGSIITLGGESGFDASANRVTVRIGDVPAATTSLTLPLFYTRTADGTNTVTTAYTNAALKVENGFIHKPVEEITE